MRTLINILLVLAITLPLGGDVNVIVGQKPVVAGGTIAIDTRANSGCSASTPTDIASFAVNAVSPLIVCIIWQGAQTISSVQWKPSAPEAFTLIDSHVDGAALNKIAFYKLTNPSTGTDTVRVNFSAAPSSGAQVFAIGTTGGTDVRTAVKRNDGNGTGPGLTDPSWASGDIEFHGAVVFAATITWDAGETTTTTTQDNICGSSSSGGVSTKTTNGTVGATDVAVYAQIAFAAF